MKEKRMITTEEKNNLEAMKYTKLALDCLLDNNPADARLNLLRANSILQSGFIRPLGVLITEAA